MPVAIRTATRIQDMDDANVSLGAGVDEYALVYDNDTAKFVLRAPFAGILATGATVGATAQAQAFTVGISLAATTTATTGVVFKGTTRFIHDFKHPTGQTAAPDGRNTFVGYEAGNFTTGATATSTAHASDNTGVGYQALNAITIGLRNVAVGSLALKSVTTGDGNCALGYYGLFSVTTGSYNMAVGPWSLQNTTGNSNVAVGVEAGNRNTTGANNIFIGTSTGQFHANGSTALTDPENSIYLGFQTRGKDNSDSNSIVIGYQAIGLGANTTVIGNTSTTAATIYGAGAFPLLSAATNTVSNLLTLTHDTSGTAAAGFGAGLLFALESSTTAAQAAARIQALWYEATHATRKADLVLTAYDTAEREGLRIRGAGSAPAIGFYGVAPIERAILATGAGATADNIITALQNLGLVKQS